ncbi:MAG: hypothetical protein AB1384_14290 [Actinomycetota bacterium]
MDYNGAADLLRRRLPRLAAAFGLTLALFLPLVWAGGCGGKKEPEPGETVQAEEGEEEAFAYTNYWSHTELPEMSNEERRALAESNQNRGEEFVQEIDAQAQALSDGLEDYIRRWLRGEVPAELPEGLLPPYIDTVKTADWTLQRPEEVDPRRQWLIIPAHAIDPDFQKCYMLGTDANVTYGKLIFVAPIASRLLVEGDFPHARYFEYEILPPLDPEHPASGTMGETPEVPMVDADIEPDAGSTNPFRVGADRNAAARHYHIFFDLRLGNAVALNPQAMKSPEYRAPGNSRTGGPFGFAGAWGDNVFTPSILWMRIYAPDRPVDVLGGVSLPRAMLQLDTGEQFWLQCDFSVASERENTRVPAGYEAPREPFPAIGPQLGWHKIFGLALIRAETLGYLESRPYGKQLSPEMVREKIRDDFLLLFNRGEDAEPPGDYEGSSTACKNNVFLTRMMQLGPGKVYAITGRMPTYPHTRDGEAVMSGGEVRYWSIGQYGKGEDDRYETAVNYGLLMDDEVALNADNEYIIVYSTAEDRPANATPENGVTWADWGPRSRQTVTIRWMSVMPEWHLPQYAPDAYNLPWATAAWSGTRFDASLVGLNQPGVMGPYHPVIHYMTAEEFEALGDLPLSAEDLPAWR